jgi:hypothetical protein
MQDAASNCFARRFQDLDLLGFSAKNGVKRLPCALPKSVRQQNGTCDWMLFHECDHSPRHVIREHRVQEV